MNIVKEVAEKFIDWTKIKIKIHFSEKDFMVKEKQIWWASIGQNVGVEQNGKNCNFERPVLVFKRFNDEQFWALPITSKVKIGKYYYIFTQNNEQYAISLSQLRVMSRKRLLRYLGDIGEADYLKIKDEILKIIK
ncbi:MAG: type II toxin-antitoxin system PemK/MazF family toxin [Candidatus Magasanikbacteria bacterium]|nr:type II toxin-antitoxin system PemK/MazF family toxin [Candidatus Magasanikbacteria bacterium]